MTTESIKLELIVWINHLKDNKLLTKLLSLKEVSTPPQKPGRKAGWGKSIFLYVAPDFDDTPEGFEDYMPA
ncbi:MAG: hypothetical protein EPO28_07835 [Saprospiraceae bacterium]|nr:MAG: hypothetical protein EPO28_07835 [Saprospiraceae bacterium]